MNIEQSIKGGDLPGALKAAQDAVRNDPADSTKRVALFQIECVGGRWEKAHAQLEALAGLDAEGAMLATIFASVLVGEATRADVFSGLRTPIIFGEPAPWVSLLVEACAATAAGRYEASATLRTQALNDATPSLGAVDGHPFAWIADGDSRLGPLLEVIMEGGYRWVPFSQIRSVRMEPPHDLRDLVWRAAHFEWINGGTATGFIPVRYPEAELLADPNFALARRTEWIESPGETYLGRGQRILTTDKEDYALLDIQEIIFTSESSEEATRG